MPEIENNQNVPRHVAIIMDGNGRWAKSRNLPRTKGHLEGLKRVEEIVDTARECGVKILTMFTFSTENWNRPEAEVSMLMELLMAAIQNKTKHLKETGVRFNVIGRRHELPKNVRDMIETAMEETKANNTLILNLAINYGSRLEILDAIRAIARRVKSGEQDIDHIDEQTVSAHLYTHNLPDPDLLIRTSGEKRVSNFLLWQLSYAEFYFTDVFWPDFDSKEFEKAIQDYQSRERRFGALAQGITHE